jgi:hypothetical protein
MSKKIRPTGIMTSVANEIGYKRITDIPFDKVNNYADSLVNKCGEKNTKEMLMRQIIYRKNIPSITKNKLISMYEHIRSSDNSIGITDIVKDSGKNFIKGLSTGMGLSGTK